MRASGWLFLALNLTFAAPGSAATSRLDSILASRVLRVGTTGDYRPFTSVDKATGEYSGLDIDLARSLGRASVRRSISCPRRGRALPATSQAGPSISRSAGFPSRSTGRRPASSPPRICVTERRRSPDGPTRPSIIRWRTSTGPKSASSPIPAARTSVSTRPPACGRHRRLPRQSDHLRPFGRRRRRRDDHRRFGDALSREAAPECPVPTSRSARRPSGCSPTGAQGFRRSMAALRDGGRRVRRPLCEMVPLKTAGRL